MRVGSGPHGRLKRGNEGRYGPQPAGVLRRGSENGRGRGPDGPVHRGPVLFLGRHAVPVPEALQGGIRPLRERKCPGSVKMVLPFRRTGLHSGLPQRLQRHAGRNQQHPQGPEGSPALGGVSEGQGGHAGLLLQYGGGVPAPEGLRKRQPLVPHRHGSGGFLLHRLPGPGIPGGGQGSAHGREGGAASVRPGGGERK